MIQEEEERIVIYPWFIRFYND